MERYLISCWYYREALEIARSMGLKMNEWTYIPFNEMDRERKLVGRRVKDIKYLIGGFTDEEKEYLIHTPRVKKMKKLSPMGERVIGKTKKIF